MCTSQDCPVVCTLKLDEYARWHLHLKSENYRAYVISIYSDDFIEMRDIFGDDFLALSWLLSADCLIFARIFLFLLGL